MPLVLAPTLVLLALAAPALPQAARTEDAGTSPVIRGDGLKRTVHCNRARVTVHGPRQRDRDARPVRARRRLRERSQDRDRGDGVARACREPATTSGGFAASTGRSRHAEPRGHHPREADLARGVREHPGADVHRMSGDASGTPGHRADDRRRRGPRRAPAGAGARRESAVRVDRAAARAARALRRRVHARPGLAQPPVRGGVRRLAGADGASLRKGPDLGRLTPDRPARCGWTGWASCSSRTRVTGPRPRTSRRCSSGAFRGHAGTWACWESIRRCTARAGALRLMQPIFERCGRGGPVPSSWRRCASATSACHLRRAA